MRTFRLALAQINATVGEFESNTQKVLEGVERARDAHADLVAFPELAIPGYPPEDLLLKPSFVRANERALQKIVPEVRGLVAVVGYAHLDGDLYNAAAVVADGDLKASYHKHFLPTYGVFDEDRYFRRGAEAPIFEIAGTRVGVCICEDIWYPSGPAEWQSWAGAELIVNINGSPFRSGIDEFRRRMLATRAADHVVALGYVNLVGGQDELVFDGASLAFDADGNLLASAPAFEEDLLVVDIDMDGVARERLHDPRMRKVSAPPPEISTPELFISGERAAQRSPITPRFTEQRTQDDDVYKALVLGTRDYVRKNGFRQVFIALSGGIDSALTAAIAVDALGAEAVTGVVMSSKYSSEHSRADAFELGRRLGIEVLDISIQEPHRAMDEELRAHIAQQPGQDLAEQNVQSRIRGLYMMALANARPWSIVLTTGNKSELATGYATLYGDMAGGFAVLKDVPKTVAIVIRMVDQNEYKRRQSPPGPKVTSKAFGRDRRLPVTNRFQDGA